MKAISNSDYYNIRDHLNLSLKNLYCNPIQGFLLKMNIQRPYYTYGIVYHEKYIRSYNIYTAVYLPDAPDGLLDGK